MNVGWHNGGMQPGGGTSWLLVFATDFMWHEATANSHRFR